MIVIRLARGGAKNNPFYRIVAIDKKRKRGGKPLENLGYWYPKRKDLRIDMRKVSEWKQKGAQVTKAVEKLIDQK